MTWDQAIRYAAWLSSISGKTYRLLSEAEWEYAARAGTQTTYSWGNEIGRGNANCNGCGSRWDNREAAPVGSFSPNAFGLYDMHGNVAEWVEDCGNNDYHGAPQDGSAWTTGQCDMRVLRGGSWLNEPRIIASASRISSVHTIAYQHLGFRMARTLATTSPSALPASQLKGAAREVEAAKAEAAKAAIQAAKARAEAEKARQGRP